jgi:hypothetical protein
MIEATRLPFDLPSVRRKKRAMDFAGGNQSSMPRLPGFDERLAFDTDADRPHPHFVNADACRSRRRSIASPMPMDATHFFMKAIAVTVALGIPALPLDIAATRALAQQTGAGLRIYAGLLS